LITIGVDAHKSVHVALALGDAGESIAEWRGANSPEGWDALRNWSLSLTGDCLWGIVGAWGNGRGLAQLLVGAGETVYEINARWTALRRRSARTPGKTDSLDARAVALFVRQEAPDLPRVYPEDDTSILDLLSTEREAAIAEATRLRNQIHALLLWIDPQYRARLPSLVSKAGLSALEAYSCPGQTPLQAYRVASVRRLALRLRLVHEQAQGLANQISELAHTRFTPLMRLCGINALTAGALAGVLGPGQRFASDAELAAYAGVSPLEASSAGRTRHRLNRGGNRRLNAIFYRIVLTQAHYLPAARTYIERRLTDGKTRRDAHRCLRRYVARAVWHLWNECLAAGEIGKSKAAA
jgi:transposase